MALRLEDKKEIVAAVNKAALGAFSAVVADYRGLTVAQLTELRSKAREQNVGWRIDYVLASAAAMRFVRGAFINPDDLGSDHCPVGVEVDPAITRPGRPASRTTGRARPKSGSRARRSGSRAAPPP